MLYTYYMTTTKPENTGRNQDGTFAPGVSGNPAGKPKGAKHLTTLLFTALQKKVPGKDFTYQDKLVERILTEAIVKGKGDMIKLAMNYVDGMPQQGIDITSNDEPIKGINDIDVLEIARRVSAELKSKKTK